MASLPESVAERVEARPLAVDRRAGTVHFDVQGAASSSVSESGGVEVHCETLDTLLEGEAATFIKMDIEGAELEALEGAAGQIRAHRPTLAISAYHRQGHLWQVPMAIHALCPEYDFYLRRHSPEILDELVLYAIPQRQ
jgi:hypothetical protein